MDTEKLEPLLSYQGIDRLYEYDPSKKHLDSLMDQYELHEIIADDIVELSTQDKIDVYDQCLFVVLHFPKYDKAANRYYGNEFNMILGKNYIITLTNYHTQHMIKLKETLLADLQEADASEKHKISPYYLLYRIMDTMYDKTLNSLSNFTKELRTIETNIFRSQRLDKNLIEQIMLRKRSAVNLKHMFLPHQDIIGPLQQEMLKFFGGELDVYFEDLAYKIDKILNIVEILQEDIESLYDTYNAMVNVKTNTIVTMLTIFTGVTGILTLIAGIYGMNIMLPRQDYPHAFSLLVIAMVVITCVMLYRFFHKKRL